MDYIPAVQLAVVGSDPAIVCVYVWVTLQSISYVYPMSNTSIVCVGDITEHIVCISGVRHFMYM